MNYSEKMKDLKNWKEVTRGIYRYVIGASVCYEIHILCWCHDTDIKTAKAKLYIVGEWFTETNGTVFEREELICNPLFECIDFAIKDNEKNNEDG